MKQLPEGYRALVLGSSGTLGSAWMQALEAEPSRAARPCRA